MKVLLLFLSVYLAVLCNAASVDQSQYLEPGRAKPEDVVQLFGSENGHVKNTIASMGQKFKSLIVSNTHRAITSSIRLSSTATASAEDDAPIEIENPYKKEKKLCILCKLNITPDYKNHRLLSQFQSPYTGRIYGRHITGLCKEKQKLVEEEIVKAQNCAYMPYYYKDKQFLKDPKLFDPENPIRSHRF